MPRCVRERIKSSGTVSDGLVWTIQARVEEPHVYCDRVTSMNSWSYTAVALKSGAGSPTSLPSAAQRSALAPLAGRAATVRALAGAQARERRDELASIVSDLVHDRIFELQILQQGSRTQMFG